MPEYLYKDFTPINIVRCVMCDKKISKTAAHQDDLNPNYHYCSENCFNKFNFGDNGE
jgi:hypothetical protein